MTKVLRDAPGVRQSLIELLEADPPSDQLQAEIERQREGGHPVHAWLLSILTNLSFSEAEARRHWGRIRSHRESLRAGLGRDVGLRVALLDYFVNLNRELKNPKVIEISIYERTERSAVTDGLTGLHNHAYFLQSLRRELQRSKRYHLHLSLIMLDLDDFKSLNDTRGHREGDRVLVKAAGLIEGSLREIDVAARYGGEEFAVVLPDTPRTGAHVVAERIRYRVEQHLHRIRRGGVTISGGVACFPDDAASAEELIERADRGLYRSKRAGKNRVTLAGGERRRYNRATIQRAVTVNGGTRRRAARTKNLSEGGVLLSLKEPVPLGARLSMVLKPRHPTPALDLHGEVVRVLQAPGKEAVYDVGLRLLGGREQALVALGRGARGHA